MLLTRTCGHVHKPKHTCSPLRVILVCWVMTKQVSLSKMRSDAGLVRDRRGKGKAAMEESPLHSPSSSPQMPEGQSTICVSVLMACGLRHEP